MSINKGLISSLGSFQLSFPSEWYQECDRFYSNMRPFKNLMHWSFLEFTHPFTFIGMQWVLFTYSCLWSPNLVWFFFVCFFFGVFCLLCPLTSEHWVLLYILTYCLLMFITLSGIFNNSFCWCLSVFLVYLTIIFILVCVCEWYVKSGVWKI